MKLIKRILRILFRFNMKKFYVKSKIEITEMNFAHETSFKNTSQELFRLAGLKITDSFRYLEDVRFMLIEI